MTTPLLPPLTPTHSGSMPAVNRVYHCDWLALVSALPNQSVDAVVTDPPYDMTELDFEEAIDWPLFWQEARRISKSKRTPWILFSQQPFTTDLIMSNRKAFRNEIVYEKTMPTGFLNANRYPLRCHENIIVFADKMPDYEPQMERTDDIKALARKRGHTAHYNKHEAQDYDDDGSRYPRSVWKFAQRDTAFENTKTLHPTQKPLALMERLILTYSDAGDLICDPFCGSGSTLLAAANQGRNFIGCDSSVKWATEARARLAMPYTLPMFAANATA